MVVLEAEEAAASGGNCRMTWAVDQTWTLER